MSDSDSFEFDEGTEPPTDSDRAAARADPADEVTPVDELADEFNPGDVWDTDVDALGTYKVQRHRNGDRTVLQLSSFGDGYQILAFEVDAGGQLLATEEVNSAENFARATSICEYWIQQHPKGILGSTDDDDGGGLFGGLSIPAFLGGDDA